MSAKSLETALEKALHHHKGVVRFCNKRHLNPRPCQWHWKASKWTERSLKKVRARLRPKESVGSLSAWLCIHRYEGAWNDYGDPFWGGLQMDRSFMYSYGADMIRKYGGFAHLWTPWDQMVVAERARRSGRGYYPWPNTARMCGLI